MYYHITKVCECECFLWGMVVVEMIGLKYYNIKEEQLSLREVLMIIPMFMVKEIYLFICDIRFRM